MELTEKQLHILTHSLGLDSRHREPWRNNYATEPDDPELMPLVNSGLMIRGRSIPGGLVYYHVTKEGERIAIASLPKPKKMTRSQRRYRNYVAISDCYGDLSFADFLRDPYFKKYHNGTYNN